MNVEAVKEQLAETYPRANIKENPSPDGRVTEIVAEIDRQLVGSERDVAVVVADSSVEHMHKEITEEYEVLRGCLKVWRNGTMTEVQEGERIIIEPQTWHRVEGDETWFYCYSVPDWFPEDYYPREPAAS